MGEREGILVWVDRDVWIVVLWAERKEYKGE